MAATPTCFQQRRDTALLEFVTLYANEYPDMRGADMTLMFVVTKQDGAAALKVFPINLSRAELTRQVEAFREACADRVLPRLRSGAALPTGGRL